MARTPGLTHVAYYCWRCKGLNLEACRSDSVPIYVPEEWAELLEAEIDEQDED